MFKGLVTIFSRVKKREGEDFEEITWSSRGTGGYQSPPPLQGDKNEWSLSPSYFSTVSYPHLPRPSDFS